VTRLQDLHSEIRKHKLTRTTLILVGEAIGSRKNRSRLYHTTHAHIFRKRSRARKSPPVGAEQGSYGDENDTRC